VFCVSDRQKPPAGLTFELNKVTHRVNGKAAGSRNQRLVPVSTLDIVYFSCVEMLLNLVFNVVPMELTVAMITTEMPAAMRPYSIAVAPDSSFRNAKTLDIDSLRVIAGLCASLPATD